MIADVFLTIIGVAVILLIMTAVLSPIETLSWWAGWTEKELDELSTANASVTKTRDDAHKRYIIYLSGIASISGQFLIPREKAFIKGLRKNIPGAVIIDDVFPYSPAGLHLLAAPRFFDRLWRRIQKTKLEGRGSLLSLLINMRNVFQVMISADHRYGPIFNQGAAHVIEKALVDAGYVPGADAPITIIGYSGGGQVAIGAAAFLTSRLKAPIDIISIGGVMASDPGLQFIRRLHYVYGDGDNIQKIGAMMFPERWKALAHSEWNAAKRDGRILFHKVDNMLHAGARGYFGLPRIDGISNNEKTLEMVVEILSPITSPSLPNLSHSRPV